MKWNTRSSVAKAKILSAAAAVLMIGVILVALPLTIPKLFGIQIYNLLTPSMEPALSVGSAVYVAPCSPENLMPGEIIAFTPAEKPMWCRRTVSQKINPNHNS